MCLPSHPTRRACQEQCLGMGMPRDQDSRPDVALAQTEASNARMKTEFQAGSALHILEMLTLKCLFLSCVQVQLWIRRAVFLN